MGVPTMTGSSVGALSAAQISLEEPRQLIYELVPKFSAALDVQAVEKIQKRIKDLRQSRQPIIEASCENVQTWLKKVDVLKLEAQRPAHMSVERHEERMAQFEKEKFSAAKSIRDLENIVEALETQIMDMQQQYQALRKNNVEPLEPSEIELRLRIYRSFGVTLVDDFIVHDEGANKKSIDSDHLTPGPVKIRISKRTTLERLYFIATLGPPSLNDIHTLVIDPAKYSDFFYTNYVWEMCSLE